MQGLTRCQSPWVLGPVDWQPHRVKQAAIWLSQRLRKPLLKLTDADYTANSLQVRAVADAACTSKKFEKTHPAA